MRGAGRQLLLLVFLFSALVYSQPPVSQPLPSESGFTIGPSCVSALGEGEAKRLVREALDEGQACLGRLATPVADHNWGKLNQRLDTSTEGITLDCPSAFEPEGETSNPSRGKPVTIRINVDRHLPAGWLPDHKLPLPRTNAGELKSTLFHELMHAIGYRHGEDIDFPYACEACCYETADSRKRELGCRICAGNYAGPRDPGYLRDGLALASHIDELWRWIRMQVWERIDEHPEDRASRFLVLAAENNPDFADALAEALRKRYPKLSRSEAGDVGMAEDYALASMIATYTKAAVPLAEACIAAWDEDLEAAVAGLERFSGTVERPIRRGNEPDRALFWIALHLRKQLLSKLDAALETEPNEGPRRQLLKSWLESVSRLSLDVPPVVKPKPSARGHERGEAPEELPQRRDSHDRQGPRL